ncbi:MAG: hypothetical protein NTY93_03065 [Candidatus Kaiserbacteria bacterium]|nr:hypothetical protein [Candidatus Kaiserbacteria bacterium]
MNRNIFIIILALIALASGVYFFSVNKGGAPDFSKSFLQCSPREFTAKFAGASTYVITIFGVENGACHYTAKVVDQNGTIIPGGPGGIDCNVPLASVTPDVLNHLLGQDTTPSIAAEQSELQAAYCTKTNQ